MQAMKLGRGQRVVGMSVVPAAVTSAVGQGQEGEDNDEQEGPTSLDTSAGPWLLMVSQQVPLWLHTATVFAA